MVTLEPKFHDFPRIRKALKIYMVTSVITGIMLLLLVSVMVMKYGFNVILFINTPEAFFKFYPTPPPGQELVVPGFNVFKAFLIAHGWFYVIYLISIFMLWSPMRWPFWRFLLLAMGGIIPFLSFFLEAKTVKEVNAYLTGREATAVATEEVIVEGNKDGS